MNTLNGFWRAIVVANDDPQMRGRVRVKIPQLHGEAIPDNACPWAELITFGGNGGFGDLYNYKPNDLVIVGFEAGDATKPLIFGGWFTDQSFPQDLRSSTLIYANARDRWRRQGRAGNIIEMDERTGSRRIYLQAGDTSIELNQDTKVITVKTATGEVLVQAPTVRVESTSATLVTTTASVQAQTITINSSGSTTIHASQNLLLQADAEFSIVAPIVVIDSPDVSFTSDPSDPGSTWG